MTMIDSSPSQNSGAAGEPSAVRLETDGDLAFIVIDNPPVNASSVAVRSGLLDAIEGMSADPNIKAGIIIGAGSTFVAGSDIKEFGRALPPPELPTVLAAIEACPKPIAAAIHGAALGGGLELALACDARIALADAIVGLPEVTLGMIPGAGGTQRLPRLTGIAKALDLVTSGRRIGAREAAKLGIIDHVVEGTSLRDGAAEFVRALSGKRVVAELSVPYEPEETIAAAEQNALKSGRGREAVAEAVKAVKNAAVLPVREALAEERATFQRLRNSEEAAALRYNFFAERQAGKLDGSAKARAVKTVGVVGAGTMGAGIAAVCAAASLDVILVDASAASLEAGKGRVTAALTDLHRVGKLKAASAEEAAGHVAYANDIAALAGVDLIIEAVFEDMQVKTGVLQRLATTVRADAVIATNTSYLDLDQLAEATNRPQDVIGLHFFAPVHRMRLLEVVRGAKSDPAALATGVWLAKTIGKLPIIAGVCEGFIGNRIYAKYRAQCEFMLEEGALPRELDTAMEDLGFSMGPFAVSDLSGLDIAWAMRKRKAATRDPRERYVGIADQICEMGRLGRKTGAGWYDYSAGSGRGAVDPVVTELVQAESRKQGRPQKAFAKAEMQGRVLGTILNEAALLLAEGIARSAAEIDLVLVNGFGFSKFRGGPIFQASRKTPAEVDAMVEAAAQATGFGFRRGDVASLIAGVGN
ncbi:3-hydroxyacyl-CoA dehydrogenase NAD-binding domain-containing protein [Mesorhizobium sp. ASY16-5R]|uniref:3-hydroxyacyl-CoA dehydrogenase NAD-binding domain-containing protein n=1 Tax=Mesorhizobium sp. ASY16-5R TaxID=3445772 RepID=UPI003F9F8D48